MISQWKSKLTAHLGRLDLNRCQNLVNSSHHHYHSPLFRRYCYRCWIRSSLIRDRRSLLRMEMIDDHPHPDLHSIGF